MPLWDLRRAVVRFALSSAVGVLVWIAHRPRVEWFIGAVLSWDASALAMIVLSWMVILRADPAETRRRAGAEDAGRLAVWGLAISASLFSLFAAVFVLRRVRTFPQHQAAWWTGFALAAIALSWVLTHTAYTLRYAHLYYRDTGHSRRAAGGLKFPGEGYQPCDMDFAYFAFTLGMCFQVSDVSVTSWRIRREVLLHALLAFVYNTTILALALNLVSGLLG